MYAVIETGGKQYRVSEGDIITVEKLDAEVGSTLTIKEVVVLSKDESLKIGTPYVAGASVKAEVPEPMLWHQHQNQHSQLQPSRCHSLPR